MNQGAAAFLMSSSNADALGVLEDKRVYLHGAGEAADDLISLRPRLDGSWAMQTAIDRALDQAAKATGDIKHLDLYSCFQCAVFSSTAALGIDWKSDQRPHTLTGGLPFFGSPGNYYSLPGSAEMVSTLRRDHGTSAMVLSQGAWV